MVFLILTVVAAGNGVRVMWGEVIKRAYNGSSYGASWAGGAAVMSGVFISLLCLAGYHCKIKGEGKTTNEDVRRVFERYWGRKEERGRVVVEGKRFGNIWDEGFWRNTFTFKGKAYLPPWVGGVEEEEGDEPVLHTTGRGGGEWITDMRTRIILDREYVIPEYCDTGT
jgi:hypothetical protein